MTTPITPTQPAVPVAPPPPAQPNGQTAPPIQPVAPIPAVPVTDPAPVAYPPAAPATGPLGISLTPPAAPPQGQIVLPPPQPIPAHEPLDDGDDPTDPLPARARRIRPIDENHPQVKKLLRQRLDAQLAELTTQQDRAKLELTEQLKLQLVDAQAAAKTHLDAVAASQRQYALLSAIVASGHQLHPNAAPFVEYSVTAKMQAEGLQAQDALAAVLAENPYLVATQAPQPLAAPVQPVPGQVPQLPVQPIAPPVQLAPGQAIPPGQVPPAPVYPAPAPAQIPQYPQLYAQQAAAAGMQAQTGPGVPQAVQVVPLVSTTPRVAPATQTPVPIGQPQVVDARKMSPQEFAAYRSKTYGVA